METLLIPLYMASVKAGFPSPALDYMEERIDLNKVFIKHPLSTFIVQCEGDSMINAFIPPKAKLIVDRAVTVRSGDIVLVSINGEFTVKYLKKNDYNCWLVPANPKYREIKVTAEMDMQVFGVVTSIIIDPNDIRQCMI